MTVQDENYSELMETNHLPKFDPVAVRVVAAAPLAIEDRPTRTWAVGQVTLQSTDAPRQLLGSHPGRVRVRIKAVGAGSIFVGPSVQTATPLSGYPIMNWAGEEIVLTSRHEIYASTQVNGAVAYWCAEYLDG
jgi:hypothetical protein